MLLYRSEEEPELELAPPRGPDWNSDKESKDGVAVPDPGVWSSRREANGFLVSILASLVGDTRPSSSRRVAKQRAK